LLRQFSFHSPLIITIWPLHYLYRPKCGKSCRTRSTYCTTGNHWVHYKYQNLTPVEIRPIEDTDDTESYYTLQWIWHWLSHTMHMSLSIRFIVLSHLMHCCCCSCSSDCIASSALVSFSCWHSVPKMREIM
jgi:hypothetical protein